MTEPNMNAFRNQKLVAPPVINALGNCTSLGGSAMRACAVDAMRDISSTFVDLNALYDRAGDRVAQLCRAPSDYTAHIVTGAAAGLALSAAACMSGMNTARIRSLPDTAQCPRNSVVLDADGDPRWDGSIRLSGCNIRRVNSRNVQLLKQTLCADDVACLIWFDGYNIDTITTEEAIAIAHAAGVPCIVDAAARLPPLQNLWRFTHVGADCVLFSGGKAIRGPQTSGLMIGRRDLIQAIRANGSPNEATVCRPMKTSKECVVGLVAALEEFVHEQRGDYRHVLSPIVDVLQRGLESLPSGAVCVKAEPTTDVQPNAHTFLAVNLSYGLEDLNAEARETIQANSHATSATRDLYGESVDHGSPLKIVPTSVPTLVAHRLAIGQPPVAVVRIPVHCSLGHCSFVRYMYTRM